MIHKEIYKTREDGVQLYHTYSDTDHLIRNKTTNAIYSDAVDIASEEEYEEVDGYIELEGAESYEEILSVEESMNLITKKINRIHLTNNEALSVKEFYPHWDTKLNKTIEKDFKVFHDGKLWRCRQTHIAIENYSPSIYTSSIWEVIEEEHSGLIDDAIPYVPPMEIFKGKYYTENDVLYLCVRDSETALTHHLSDVVGLYVEYSDI